MKILINILNVLGAIISSFLMPVLLIALIACPVANAVSSLTHPETITDMIDKIDINEFASADPVIEQAIEKLEIPIDMIDGLLDLEIVEQFTTMYLEDAEAQLIGMQSGTLITEKKLLAMLEDNMDDIIEFIREYASEDVKDKTDQEIKDELISEAEEFAPELISSLPPMSEVIDEISELGVDQEIISEGYVFIKESLMPMMYTIIIILSLLIFGCRAYHLEGTIWLGIDYILASIAIFVVSSFANAIIGTLDFIGGISPLKGMLGSVTNPFAIAYLLIGVAFIGAFVGVRVYISKKRKSLVNAQNGQAYSYYPQSFNDADAPNANPYSAKATPYTYGNANPYSAENQQYIPQYNENTDSTNENDTQSN